MLVEFRYNIENRHHISETTCYLVNRRMSNEETADVKLNKEKQLRCEVSLDISCDLGGDSVES